MKRFLLLVLFPLLLVSCGSSRTATHITQKTSIKKSEAIVKYAKSFDGTRYKFGGTTKSGMDCSGLVYVSYKKENITIPRVSKDMAKTGKRISLRKAKKGDLLFFKTMKNKNVINHVGLIIENKRGKILFIHSTTSKGVIISSLDENYWKNTFVEVRKVI